MKMIVAIVQPQQFPDIKDALLAAGFENMTCTNILGTVANQHEEYKYRGVSQDITLFQKLRIEIGVTDEQVQNVIESLSEGVNKSGGTGIAFVTELFECIELRTNSPVSTLL